MTRPKTSRRSPDQLEAELISELRALRRVKRDPRATEATYRAIVGKPAHAGWFRRFGWQAGAALLAAVLVVPAAVDLVSGSDPLTTVRGTVDRLGGKPERAGLAPASPTPVQAPAAAPAPPVPAAQIAPETQAAPIEQAPVTAPAVDRQHPRAVPDWLLKETRSHTTERLPRPDASRRDD